MRLVTSPKWLLVPSLSSHFSLCSLCAKSITSKESLPPHIQPTQNLRLGSHSHHHHHHHHYRHLPPLPIHPPVRIVPVVHATPSPAHPHPQRKMPLPKKLPNTKCIVSGNTFKENMSSLPSTPQNLKSTRIRRRKETRRRHIGSGRR